jgi:hypothetical protein
LDIFGNENRLWGRQYQNSFAFDDLGSEFADIAKIAGDVRAVKIG